MHPGGVKFMSLGQTGKLECWNIGKENNHKPGDRGARSLSALKPSFPVFHYSNFPEHVFPAEPIVSDLVQRARVSRSH
ncbi:MAG: hypothetical protein CVU64_17845 [Deltaproteobacteria bacterium HGW-Deltaproteobacteria-21]|nr:MAG: hypothetical protein CVU64_17845 [Deltaproteobacteria bacterium HGW-Deltaproteobacteria-21]